MKLDSQPSDITMPCIRSSWYWPFRLASIFVLILGFTIKSLAVCGPCWERNVIVDHMSTLSERLAFLSQSTQAIRDNLDNDNVADNARPAVEEALRQMEQEIVSIQAELTNLGELYASAGDCECDLPQHDNEWDDLDDTPDENPNYDPYWQDIPEDVPTFDPSVLASTDIPPSDPQDIP